MQHSRSGASNVRFVSPASSRPATVTSVTEEYTERSRASSARTSSINEGRANGQQPYEIWEPPDEAVLDHYKPIPGESKVSPGTRLGQAVAAVVRAKYTGQSVDLPRFSLLRSTLGRTRSVASESDITASSVSRGELIRDAQRLGLPIRAPTAPPRPTVVPPRPVLGSVRPVTAPPRETTVLPRPVVAPPKPIVAPPKPVITPPKPIATAPRPTPAPLLAPVPVPAPAPAPSPPAPRPVPAHSPLASRTLAAATAPSTANPQGATIPTNPNTYQVWRPSVARPRDRVATSPYTRMIDDAMYKPKPLPPAGTIIESGGEGILRAERALYADMSERFADERIFWSMPPDHDERVRNRIQAVDKMSRELALYGLDMYLESGIKGAIMTNAGYRAPEWPESPAFDWITFNDARRTGDKVLQESIAFSDPATTTLVFIFLVSRSGESMAIWRRKFTVPPSEQLRRNLELRRVTLEAQRLRQVYQIDLNPPMKIPEDAWVVVKPGKQKKRHKFPWFKVDWGN